MKKFNKQTGRKGELEAKKLLRKKGYKILEMNWGSKWGEVDLVCIDSGQARMTTRRGGETVVFVEVKAKTGDGYGAPWQMVGRRKLDQVKRIGEMYLAEKGWQDKPCRIDVVGVVFNRAGKVVNINHYENVC
jgi:putative endonuclease